MSILLSAIGNPPNSYFLHRDSILSSAFLPKHPVFVPPRANTCRGSSQKRTWWDSDAESTTKKRSSKSWVLEDNEDEGREGSWWSGSFDDYDSYYDDEIDSTRFEDEPDWTDMGFFKEQEEGDNEKEGGVLKSYGWMLPAILISMLLGTGPKAFLMALALPLGQSVLSFAFDKMWGKADTVRKRPRSKFRKQKFASSSASDSHDRKVPRDTVSEENNRESWVSGKTNEARPTYGGWDELDIRRKGSRGQTAGLRRSGDGARKTGSQRKSKMVRKGRSGDMSLLLRLLIAVFPFLGTWVKIL